MAAEEGRILRLDRSEAADWAGDERHRIRIAGAVDRGAVLFGVDPRHGGREAVRIAFAAHLAVADDVDADLFLIAYRHQLRSFLRLGAPLRRDPPPRFGAHQPARAGPPPPPET